MQHINNGDFKEAQILDLCPCLILGDWDLRAHNWYLSSSFRILLNCIYFRHLWLVLLMVREIRIRNASFICQCNLLELRPVFQKCMLEVTRKPGANPELIQHRARRQKLGKGVYLPTAI